MTLPPPIMHAAATATEATLLIDGKTYPAFGVYPSIPTFKYDKDTGPLFYGTVKMPNPFPPPEGWGFAPYVIKSIGQQFVTRSDGWTSSTEIRIWQASWNNPSALKKLGWRLVRV